MIANHAESPHPNNVPKEAFDILRTSPRTSLIAAYTHDGDPDRVLSLLATWLGHSDAAHTYWYLSATGELMALAAERLEPTPENAEGGRS